MKPIFKAAFWGAAAMLMAASIKRDWTGDKFTLAADCAVLLWALLNVIDLARKERP